MAPTQSTLSTSKYMFKGKIPTGLLATHHLPTFLSLFNTLDEGERFRALNNFIRTLHDWQSLYEVNTANNFNKLMNLFKKYKIETSEIPDVVRVRKFRKPKNRQAMYDAKFEQQMWSPSTMIENVLQPSIDNAQGAVKKAVADGMYQGYEKIQETILGQLNAFKEEFFFQLGLTANGAIFSHLTRIFQFMNKIVVLVLAAKTDNWLALYSVLSDSCVSIFRSIVSPQNGTYQAQGTGVTSALKEWFSAALDEVCDNLQLPRLFKSVTGFMAGILQMLDAGVRMKDLLLNLVDHLLNWLSNLTTEFGWTERWYVSTYQKFKQLKDYYDELRFHTTLKSDLIRGKPEWCEKVLYTERELKTLLPKLGKKNQSQSLSLNAMLRDVSEWKNLVPVTFNSKYTPRIEPIWINIHGKPGVGKTQTVKPRIVAITHMVARKKGLVEKERSQEIYNFNPSEPFWDAYSGQGIFETTDLAQVMSDEQANFTLIDAITHIVESAEYRPLVADPSKKGNIEPRPVAWITDSQQSLERCSHLTNSTLSKGSHMLRRIGFEIEVEFNDGADHETEPENRWRYMVYKPHFTRGFSSGPTVTMRLAHEAFTSTSAFYRWITNEITNYYDKQATQKEDREAELDALLKDLFPVMEKQSGSSEVLNYTHEQFIVWYQNLTAEQQLASSSIVMEWCTKNYANINDFINSMANSSSSSSSEEDLTIYDDGSDVREIFVQPFAYSGQENLSEIVDDAENASVIDVQSILHYLKQRGLSLIMFFEKLSDQVRARFARVLPGFQDFVESNCPQFFSWRKTLLVCGGVLASILIGAKLVKCCLSAGDYDEQSSPLEQQRERSVRRPLKQQSGPREQQQERSIRRPLKQQSGPREQQQEKSVRRPLKQQQSGPREQQQEKTVRRPLHLQQSGPREQQQEKTVRRPLGLPQFLQQGGDYVYEIEKFRNSIRNNFHYIQVEAGEGVVATNMWILQIRPSLFVIPTHCWQKLCEFKTLVIFTRSMANRINISEVEAWTPDTRDLTFLKIMGMPSATDISKYFSHHDTPLPREMVHAIFKPRENYFKINDTFHVTAVDRGVSDRVHTEDGFSYAILDTSAQTFRGDCGTPYFVRVDNRFYLTGIHTAMLKRPSYQQNLVSYIWHEDIDAAQSHFVTLEPCNAGSEFITQGTDAGLEELGLMVTGKLGPIDGVEKPRPPIPNTTKFVESPLGEALDQSGYTTEFRRAPARLRPFTDKNGERISPAHLSLKKLTNVTARMPDKFFNPITRYMEKYYSSFPSFYASDYRRELSIEEAIRGIPGIFESFRLKTSPGYPYVLTAAGKGKRKWIEFGSDGEIVKVHPELRERVNKLIDLMKCGKYEQIVVLDTLKDELLPVEKVERGKVRIFQVLPMEINIIGRMYFLSFYNHLKENCVDQPVSTGIDPKSLAWDALLRRLARANSKALDPSVPAWIAGDYQNYDSTLHRRVGENHAAIANYWYQDGPENSCLRTTLMAALFSCAHCFGDTIFENVQGNPSGQFGTTQVNSTGNHLMFLFSYCKYFGLEVLDKHHSLHPTGNMELATVGDDNLACLSPAAIRGGFSALQHAESLKSIGVNYTSTDKTSKIVPLLTLPEVTFLKRDFYYHRRLQRYIGRLDLATASTIGYWIDRNNLNDADIYAAHVKDLYEECALWEGPHFDSLRRSLPKVRDLFRNNKICFGQQCLAYHRHNQECRNCPHELDEFNHIKGQMCASLHTIDLDVPNETAYEIIQRLYSPKSGNSGSDGYFVMQAGISK
jgi:hypothetical protein